MPVRWAFPDPSEAEARAQLDRRIDAWWSLVNGLGPRLEPFSSDASVSGALALIDPSLEWELAPGSSRTVRCVVSCGERPELQPLVNRIVARGPAELEPAGERRPLPFREAASLVNRRFDVDCSEWTLEFGAPEHGLLELSWRGPTGSQLDAAVALTKRLVGERAVMEWVGSIELSPPSLRARLFGRGEPLPSVAFAFKREQERVLSRRPDRPLQIHSSRGLETNWSVTTLDARRRDGFLPELTSLRCADLELMSALLSGVPFASSRFSRFAETFAYVHSEAPADDVLSLNLRLEQALDDALKPDGLGRTIAAGTGGRVSAVVLVLRDAALALERIRDASSRLELPERTWLRFSDETLANEWVGLKAGAPPPP